MSNAKTPEEARAEAIRAVAQNQRTNFSNAANAQTRQTGDAAAAKKTS